MEHMIKRSWERLNAHPSGRDAVIAVCWLLLGLALLQLGAYPLWAPLARFTTSGLAFLLVLLALAAITTQRSRHPFLALGVGTLLLCVDLLFGGSLGVVLVYTDLVYAAMKYGGARGVRRFVWALVGCAVALLSVVVIWFPRDPTAHVIAVQWVLILLVATLWGWNVRSERLRTSAALADQYAQSTQQLRQRIAHDLHDLVANEIAVAGLHVEAARLRLAAETGEPTGQTAVDHVFTESLEQAARGAAQADAQLRRMIKVLQAVDDLGDQPERTLDALVADFVAEAERQPPGARAVVWAGDGKAGLVDVLGALPPAAARLTLRVAKELIANAVKHGSGDTEVRVDGSVRQMVVTNGRDPSVVGGRGTGIGVSGADMLLAGTGMVLESRAHGPAHWVAVLRLGEHGATGREAGR